MMNRRILMLGAAIIAGGAFGLTRPATAQASTESSLCIVCIQPLVYCPDDLSYLDAACCGCGSCSSYATGCQVDGAPACPGGSAVICS
jgi:hypothetical protein